MLPARGLTGTFFLAHDACGRPPRRARRAQDALPAGAPRRGGVRARRCVAECEAVRGRRVDGRARLRRAIVWEQADERAVKHLLNYELPFDDAERDARRAVRSSPRRRRRRSRDASICAAAMVREMARRGMMFGFHTRSHRMLSRLRARRAERRSCATASSWIRGLTGQATRARSATRGAGAGTYTAETRRTPRARRLLGRVQHDGAGRDRARRRPLRAAAARHSRSAAVYRRRAGRLRGAAPSEDA